jgi:hypothetical protein
MKKLSEMGSARALPATKTAVRLAMEKARPNTVTTQICTSSRGDPPTHSLCHSPFPPPNPAKPPAASTSYHLSLATDALQRIKQIRRRRYEYALARSLALPGYPNGTPFPDRN